LGSGTKINGCEGEESFVGKFAGALIESLVESLVESFVELLAEALMESLAEAIKTSAVFTTGFAGPSVCGKGHNSRNVANNICHLSAVRISRTGPKYKPATPEL
jgi:hypothetical protein